MRLHFRLRDLLYKEERELYVETVDRAQKGDETRMEEMKKRAEILRAQKEAERQQIVEKKRIEQYKYGAFFKLSKFFVLNRVCRKETRANSPRTVQIVSHLFKTLLNDEILGTALKS